MVEGSVQRSKTRVAVAIVAIYVLFFQALFALPASYGIDTAIEAAALPCHAVVSQRGQSDGSAPAVPAGHHDCCDFCTLLAPLLLPGQPEISRFAAIAHRIETHRDAPAAVAENRMRSPRQSQGPPSRVA